MRDKKQNILLTDTQKKVAEQNALSHTAEAFEAMARGDEKLAGIHARASFRYARRIIEGVKP